MTSKANKTKAAPTPASADAKANPPAHWVAPSNVPHSGIEEVLAGHPYIFAPIPLTPLSRFLPAFNEARLAQAAAPGDFALIAALFAKVVDLVHMSLVRNYPTLTVDYVGEEMLHQGNWERVSMVVFTGSGAQQQGESAAGRR